MKYKNIKLIPANKEELQNEYGLNGTKLERKRNDKQK